MTWTTRQRSDLGGVSAIVAGAGPKIVLIHGVGLRAEAWNAQIDALAPYFSVAAVDMPGHGESPRLPDGAGLHDYAAAISAVLNEPAIVVGHSMGAMVALDIARQNPDLVLGVGALNAIFERTPAAAQAILARAARLDGVSQTDPSVALERWFGQAASSARVACGDWLRAADPAGYRAAYTTFAHEDGPTRATLENLACPALFMTGSLEPNSTPDMSYAMAQLAPLGRAMIVEGAAHMMPMTHAAQVCAALLDLAQEALA